MDLAYSLLTQHTLYRIIAFKIFFYCLPTDGDRLQVKWICQTIFCAWQIRLDTTRFWLIILQPSGEVSINVILFSLFWRNTSQGHIFCSIFNTPRDPVCNLKHNIKIQVPNADVVYSALHSFNFEKLESLIQVLFQLEKQTKYYLIVKVKSFT